MTNYEFYTEEQLDEMERSHYVGNGEGKKEEAAQSSDGEDEQNDRHSEGERKKPETESLTGEKKDNEHCGRKKTSPGTEGDDEGESAESMEGSLGGRRVSSRR